MNAEEGDTRRGQEAGLEQERIVDGEPDAIGAHGSSSGRIGLEVARGCKRHSMPRTEGAQAVAVAKNSVEPGTLV